MSSEQIEKSIKDNRPLQDAYMVGKVGGAREAAEWLSKRAARECVDGDREKGEWLKQIAAEMQGRAEKMRILLK